MTDNARTDAALAEVERRIVNLSDNTFDQGTLDAAAQIVAQMRRDCAPTPERGDGEFYRLRAQHQAGNHAECPPEYCLDIRNVEPLSRPERDGRVTQ